MEGFQQFIFTLLDPIPQYVLGSLTALAIMGASPADKFTEKIAWLFRCLGCPFTGLFYSINIGGKRESRCMYWLSSDKFVTDKGTAPKYRPFGFYAYEIQNADDGDVKKKVEQCTATMSVLDRLSMLISSYFIVVGVLALISKTIGTINCRGWPYIPTLLSWTILAILRDAFSGIIVIKDPDKIFKEGQIRINENPKSRTHKRFTVVVTTFISIFYHWIALFLAYFTPPIGYNCRREKDLTSFGQGFLHVWFSFCGFIVTILLLVLGLFTQNNKWWVDVFGDS
ncbi:8788_t:CDS:2, partial [Gigaspora margarita]